jgi:hypothetical protein
MEYRQRVCHPGTELGCAHFSSSPPFSSDLSYQSPPVLPGLSHTSPSGASCECMVSQLSSVGTRQGLLPRLTDV